MKNSNNYLDNIYSSAGIPKSYYDLKYSEVIKTIDDKVHIKVKKFLEKRCNGLFIVSDDCILPYVIFKRAMIIWDDCTFSSKIVDAYSIQNKYVNYSTEKLFGIFRIDVTMVFNKMLLIDTIHSSYKNGAKLIITSSEKDSEKIASYLSPIWDIFESSYFEFIRLIK